MKSKILVLAVAVVSLTATSALAESLVVGGEDLNWWPGNPQPTMTIGFVNTSPVDETMLAWGLGLRIINEETGALATGVQFTGLEVPGLAAAGSGYIFESRSQAIGIPVFSLDPQGLAGITDPADIPNVLPGYFPTSEVPFVGDNDAIGAAVDMASGSSFSLLAVSFGVTGDAGTYLVQSIADPFVGSSWLENDTATDVRYFDNVPLGAGYVTLGSVTVHVPEPGAIILLVSGGGLGLLFFGWRRAKRQR